MATAAAAIGGAPSSANMVVVNGSGQMQKFISSPGPVAFTYPIGDNSGNYTPASLTFSANTTAGLVGIKVISAKHPANVQINNFINRYWSITAPALTNYTYSATFQYSAADVVGTEASLFAQRYDNGTSSWTADVASSVNTGTHVLTTGSALTQITGKLDNNDYTAFNGGIGVYYWSKATGNWSVPATWEVTSTPVDPGVGLGIPATNVPTNLNSSGITIRGGINVTLNASYTVDSLNVNGTLTIPAGQTLTVANGGYNPDMVVNTTGIVTNSGTITATGTISFVGNATYNHSQNGGIIPIATWSATSKLNITFGASATLNGLSQSFGNLAYTGPGFTLTLGQSPTIQGNLTINSGTVADNGNVITVNGNITNNGTHSGLGEILLSGSSGLHVLSGTPAVYGNLELNDANGASIGSAGTTQINGALKITQGTLTLNPFATSFTIVGLVTIGASGTWDNSVNNTAVTFRGGITTQWAGYRI